MPANQTFFATEIADWDQRLPRPHEVIKTIIKRRTGKDVGAVRRYDPQFREVGSFPDGARLHPEAHHHPGRERKQS